MYLRQATASQEILLGRFVDSADGFTPETALAIANTDIKLWREGAAVLANKAAGGATHMGGGLYVATLDETDTATLGKLEVHVQVAGALPVKREYTVLAPAVYDSLILGQRDLPGGLPINDDNGLAPADVRGMEAGSVDLTGLRALIGDYNSTGGANVSKIADSSTVDGVALATFLIDLKASAGGNVVPTANVDGSTTLAFKRADGTTTAFTKTFNPATGART